MVHIKYYKYLLSKCRMETVIICSILVSPIASGKTDLNITGRFLAHSNISELAFILVNYFDIFHSINYQIKVLT